MPRIDELRLITKVAQMYYEQEMRQSEIARRLQISQASVSRLLKSAREQHIVRITVNVPNGIYPDLEDTLQQAYQLKDVVVVDCIQDDEEQIRRDLGAAAAFYLENTLGKGEVVGLSSWSGTLLAMVEAMHTVSRATNARVVQILGGIGQPQAEVHAAHLVSRLAALVRGEAVFLPAPGVTGTADARDVLLGDPFVRDTAALFGDVSLALVGIGAIEPSSLLASSGNSFAPEELDTLRAQGGVGDILLRFFDGDGQGLDTPLAQRVIGMDLAQLSRVARAVGIAGGQRKHAAIRGALEGGWINVLITDRFTAAWLVAQLQQTEEIVN
jgi:DNA-binding transcriptional regulator LsrR (DeoR family)